jgi:hypothetical protein
MPNQKRPISFDQVFSHAKKVLVLLNEFSPQFLARDNEVIVSIPNPFGNSDIDIFLDCTEIRVHFAYQHRHYDYSEIDDLVCYSRDLISDSIVSIEFFKNEMNGGGGDAFSSDMDLNTIEGIDRLGFEEFPIDINP